MLSSNDLKQQQIEFLIRQNGELYERMSELEDEKSRQHNVSRQYDEHMKNLLAKLDFSVSRRMGLNESLQRTTTQFSSVKVCSDWHSSFIHIRPNAAF